MCAAVAAALTRPVAAVGGRQPTLDLNGLGAIRLGWTVRAVERELRAKLGRLSRNSHGFSREPESSETCWQWQRRDGKDPAVVYMTDRGRVVRIEVGGDTRSASKIVTAHGIGIGSTEAQVRAAYGDAVTFEPHPIAERRRWAVLERRTTDGIRIEVEDGVVVSIFVARDSWLDAPEGCS